MSTPAPNTAATGSSLSIDLNGKKVTRKRWRKTYNTAPWTIKENYDLVMAVNSFHGKETNWLEVSKQLIAVNNQKSPRSPDWYTPDRCAQQYELSLQEYGTVFPEVVNDEPRLSRAIRFLTAEHRRIQRAERACDLAEAQKLRQQRAELDANDWRGNDHIVDEWEAGFKAELASMVYDGEVIDDGKPLPEKSIIEEILDVGLENPEDIIARLIVIWEEENKCSYKEYCAKLELEAEQNSVGELAHSDKTGTDAVQQEITGLEKGLKTTTGNQSEKLKASIPGEKKNEKVERAQVVESSSVKGSNVPLDTKTKSNISAPDAGIRHEKGTKVLDQVKTDGSNKDAEKKSRHLEKTEKNVPEDNATTTHLRKTGESADVGLKKGVEKSSNLNEMDRKNELELLEPSKRTRKRGKSEVAATERRSSARIQPPQPGNAGREKDKAKISESESATHSDASANEENKDKGGPTTMALDNLKLSEIKIEINDEQFSRSTCSSPAFSDTSNVKMDDEQHKVFKKAILVLHKRIMGHKNASLFHKPIKEENAPGYHRMILEPMDLSKIKKRIENGQINAIDAYERDITTMLLNATMFNSSKSNISILTQEMAKDVWDLIEEYRGTQLLLEQTTPHDSESGEPSSVYPIRRTRRRDSSMTILKPETIVQKLKKSSGRLSHGTSPRTRGTSASESMDSVSVERDGETGGGSRNRSDSSSVTETEGSKPGTPRKRTGSVSDKDKDKGQSHGRTFRNRSGSGNEVTMPTLRTPAARSDPDTLEHSEGTESEKMSKRKRKYSIVPAKNEEEIKNVSEGEGEPSTSKSGLKPGQTRKSRRAI